MKRKPPDADRSAMHFYLDRSRQKLLIADLRLVPDLVAELELATSKQARLGGRGGKQTKAGLAEMWPFAPDVADIADALHNTLATWARVVCEQRGLEYVPIGYACTPTFIGPLQVGRERLPRGYVETTAGLSRWLNRHVVSLALTEGAELAYDQIRDAVRDAQRVVCPPRAPVVVIDSARIDEARTEPLNAHGIATAAKELGEEYRNLTPRRVHYLAALGKIAPLVSLAKNWTPTWPKLYRLGDVLDAHLTVPIRRRHTKDAAAS